MKRLSKPLSDLAAHYDAIVVGSGYGGGAAASRLSRMGLKVALLERGEERLPGEFPDTPAEAARESQVQTPAGRVGRRTALFDLHAGADMNVLVACGLGGTSLINANVALQADPRLFDDAAWPTGIKGDGDLATGYERALAMLTPLPYPDDGKDWPALGKLEAMKEAAPRFGVPLTRPPINVSFSAGYNPAGVWQPACNLCGDCCSGCNTGAKNTTQMNYLPDAVAFGAEIVCGVRVRSVSARPGGGWNVHYIPQALGREGFKAEEPIVSADIVVLASGTLGSTEILFRSRDRGLALSGRLGAGFSGNGDVLAFGYNNDRPIDGIGFGEDSPSYDFRTDPRRPVGPTIAGLIDLRAAGSGGDDVERGMVIEEGAIPGGIGGFLPAIMAAAAAALGTDTDKGDKFAEKAREIEGLVRGPYHGAVNHTQTFLVMSHDGAGGTMRFENDRLSVEWADVGEMEGFKRVAANLEKAVAATGGTYVPNPIWTELLGHRLVTVHPLGGCGIGADAAAGVVDASCRVFAGAAGAAVHEGLYVCDGSIMPRSLGVNPLLTITAFTERAMIKLAAAKGLAIDMTPAAQQDAGAAPATVGIRFTEKMGGSLAPAGGGEPSACHFVVTVIAEDADRLLRETAHEADLIGTVHLPGVSPEPLTISGGRFNLLSQDRSQVATRLMVYRMPLTAADGRQYYFFGRKLIHDDRGPDIWADTTTLHVEIYEGADERGPLAYQGILRIDPLDFARQMTTMAVTNAPSLLVRLNTLRKFSRFFAGQLVETFGGRFATPDFYEPDKPREKRPLRVGAPEVHNVETADGKILRLTRYNGGGKGPVLFTHGLGVSSLIFSIDTIETNLLEYIHAAGYDCWLLDYRASIDLPYAGEQFTADDVADKDYPAAVAKVLEVTGKPSLQMVAHCYGAMSFAMAMLGGLQGVRAAAISQIAAHADVPFFPQRMLAYLRAPDLMRLVGARLLDARATRKRNVLARALDAFLRFAYPFRRADRTRSITSLRITALYGPLYRLDQLNEATLGAMPEMFGKANMAAFRQLSRIARKGHVVRMDGRDLLGEANIRNWAIPTLFVHGALNAAFLPSGTKRTMAAFAAVNGADLYQRLEIPATGHIDCIFGKNAAETVYPAILAHLEQTANA